MMIFDQLNHADALTWGAVLVAPGACLVAAVLMFLAIRRRPVGRTVSISSSLVLGIALVGVGLGALNALRAEAQRVNHLAHRPDLAPFAEQLVHRANDVMAWAGIFGAAAAVCAVLTLLRSRQTGTGSGGARKLVLGLGATAALAAIALVGAGVLALSSAPASVAGALDMVVASQRTALLASAPAVALQQCSAWIQWAVPVAGLAGTLLGWSFGQD
ncbi:MAG: hypothetical protein WBV82_07660 [Myxococcaceae bacterium]